MTERERRKDPRRRAYIMWHTRRQHATKCGLPFDITTEWLEDKMRAGRCEATGLPFDMRCEQRGFRDPFSPSIDRIEPAAGYTQANCRMVVSIFNYAKNEWSDGDVLRMAAALCETHGTQVPTHERPRVNSEP